MNTFSNMDVPETEVLAKVVRLDDGFHVIDSDGTMGPVCNKRTTDGYIILTPNAANRKCLNEKNANKFFDENPGGHIPLCYKETRKIGAVGTKMPNAKLISYLSPEEQEEYKAIIARAIEAKQAAENTPKTEAEKLQEKIAKAQKALEKLMAQAASMDESVEA